MTPLALSSTDRKNLIDLLIFAQQQLCIAADTVEKRNSKAVITDRLRAQAGNAADLVTKIGG